MITSKFFSAPTSIRRSRKTFYKSLVLTLSLSIGIPLLSAPSAIANLIPNAGLSNYYQMEFNMNDSITGSIGAASQSVRYTTGKSGFALNTSGTTGFKPSFGSTWLAGGVGQYGIGAFTSAFYVNATSTGSAFLLAEESSASNYFRIVLAADGSVHVQMGMGSNTPPELVSSGINLFQTGWRHIAVVRSSVTDFALYVDGSLNATLHWDGGGQGLLDFSGLTNDTVLGGSRLTLTSHASILFDELQFYGTSLTQSQIQSMMLFQTTQTPLAITTTQGRYSTAGTYLPLSTTGGSSPSQVTYSISGTGTAADCSISGNILSTSSGGTCIVTATNPGDNTYLAISSPATTITLFQTEQAPLTLTSTSSTFDLILELAVSGGSGSGALSYEVRDAENTAGCLVNLGRELLFAGAGTCWVTATKAGDISFLPTSSLPTLVTIEKANQSPLAVTTTTGTYGMSLPLHFSGGSGSGALTFVLAGGTASGCVISSGNILTTTSAGSCVVTVSRAADNNYNASFSPATAVNFGPAYQPNLVLTSLAGTYLTPLTLTSSGGNGGGQTVYSVVNGSASGCAAPAGLLTSTSAGTCMVTVIKAGDTNYQSASSPATAVTLAPADQPTFSIVQSAGTFGTPLALTTSGGSGNGGVTFAVDSGNCTLQNNVLTAAGAGRCQVTAVKAGDSNFNRVSASAVITFSALTLLAPAITTLRAGTTSSLHANFNSVPNATGYLVNVYRDIDGTPIVTSVRLVTNAGGPFDVEVTGLSPQSYQDANFQYGNTYQVRVIALGDGVNYLDSAESLTWQGRTLMEPVSKFQLSSGTYTWPVLTPFYFSSSGGSVNGTNTFSILDGGTASGCAVSNGFVISTTAGTCIVSGTRSADAIYSASTSDPMTVTFTKIAQDPLTIISNKGIYGSPIALQYQGSSVHGAVTFAVTGVGTASDCAIDSATNTLTFTSAGTCLVTATKAGNDTYDSISSPETTITIYKIAQHALYLTSLSGVVLTPLALTAEGGSTAGALTYAASEGTATGCSLDSNGALISATAGTCLVTATREANRNFDSVSSLPTEVTLGKLTQAAISLLMLDALHNPISLNSGVAGQLFIIIPQGGNGSGAFSFSGAFNKLDGCFLAGNHLTATGQVTCTIRLVKLGDGVYENLIVGVPVEFSASGNELSIISTVTAIKGNPYLLDTVGGFGTGAVTFLDAQSTGTGTCSLSGSLLLASGGTTCVVQATKAGDGTFARQFATARIFFRVPQSTLLTIDQSAGFVGTPLALSTAGGDGLGAVEFAVLTGNCTITSNYVLASTSGTCEIQGIKAGDATYQDQEARAFISFIAIQAPLNLADGSATYGDTINLAATGGSGSGIVTYALADGVPNSAGCSIAGSVLSASSVGTCSVIATNPGDSVYGAISSNPATITFGAKAITVTANNASKTYADADPASFGYTFTGLVGSDVLTGSLSRVTGENAGTYAISGSLTNANYVVTVINGTFTIGTKALTVTATSASKIYGTADPSSFAYATSGLVGSDVLTGSLSRAVGENVGTYAISLGTLANANYAITFTDGIFTITKAEQGSLATTSASANLGTAIALITTGGSGTGAVSYSVVNGTATGCSVTGTSLTAITVGTCLVTATKAGDGNYNEASAPTVTETFISVIQNQAAITVNSASTGFGGSIALVATGGSGTGAVSFNVTNGTATGCSITGSTLRSTSAGTCLVIATKAADANYLVARSSAATETFTKIAQASLVVTSVLGKVESKIALKTSGGSGSGAVTYTVTNGTAKSCTITNGVLTAKGQGTCFVTATKAGDVNYLVASSIATKVSFDSSNQGNNGKSDDDKGDKRSEDSRGNSGSKEKGN